MEKNVYSRKSRKKHTVHKVCAWMLAALMCFSALPTGSMTVHATDAETVTYWTDNAAAFESGDGTEGNPYIVATEAQLAYMAQVLSGEDAANYKSCHYKVADDVTELDMSAHEWTPIAAFSGTFDGNGVTIKRLTIKNTDVDKVSNIGFFSVLDEGALIKNIIFKETDIIATCTIPYNLCVGTIAGRSNGASIDNCATLSGKVQATGGNSKDIYAGGLVGQIYKNVTNDTKTLITNCFNGSTVEATTATGKVIRLGGIYGSIDQKGANAEIINCANIGTVTGTNAFDSADKMRFGGLGGMVTSGTVVIKNCYNAGTISAGDGCKGNVAIGGILGAGSSGKYTLENCYYAAGSFDNELGTSTALTTIQSADFVNTLNTNVQALLVSYSGLLNWNMNTDNYPIQFVETTEGGGSVDEDFLSGTGTEADPFIIEDKADLLLMANYCNENSGASGKYFKVKDGVDTISLTEEWVPIASFAGSFDGNGATIDGLSIHKSDILKIGFFAELLPGAVVQNVSFVNTDINVSNSSNHIYAGIIAGSAKAATINNCKTISGTLKATCNGGNAYVGGLVGWIINNDDKTIPIRFINSYNNSDITAVNSGGTTARVGGIFGFLNGTALEVINCANTGDVTGTNLVSGKALQVGGLAATLSNSGPTALINNFYNAGNICVTQGSVGTIKLGGLIAGAKGHTLNECYYAEESVTIPDGVTATETSLGTKKALADIKTEDFNLTLNLNATAINANQDKALANTWQLNAANYPVPTNVAAEIAYILGVSANTELGSVATEVKAPEGTTYTPHSATDLLAEGTMVRLTCTPNTGYFVESITVNGSAVDLTSLTNGVYEFELTANTTVDVVFAGCDLAVSVNDVLMGTVATTVMVPETTEYVLYESGDLPIGTSVCLTWTVDHASVSVESITINDEQATISNPTENKHIFELTGNTNVVVAFSAGDAASADIYVNPDATDGGNGSLEKPFRTLEEAKAKITALVAATPNIDITVHLMGGTYRLDTPLELGVTETSYRRVSFVDYAGDDETPVITSAKEIATGSFAKVEDEAYYSYQFPETAKVDGAWPQFRDLLVDGELATLAKTDVYVFEKNGTATTNANTTLLENIYVDEALLKDITNSNLGNLEVAYKYKWSFRRFHFEELGSAEEGLVPLKVRRAEAIYTGDYSSLVSKEYWLQNHISFLDEPGEFYYEETTGTIYYYPYTDQGDMTNVVVEYPTLDTLIEIGGENVRALVAEEKIEETYTDIKKAEKAIVTAEEAIQNGKDVAENQALILEKQALIEQNKSIIATLELDDVANFTFDGITFTGTTFNWLTNRGLFGRQGCTYLKSPSLGNSYGNGHAGQNVTCAAIYAEFADGIRVQNCTFTQLGGHAMLFNYGIDDLQVIGNTITDIGMVGVNVGIQQRRLVEDGLQGNSSDVIISNNYLSNVGYAVLCAPAIRVARGEDIAITHNTIIHTPYSAIAAGWGFTPLDNYVDSDPGLQNAEIAYNYIEDYLYALNDGGAIYTNGSNALLDDASSVNFIHDNYIRAGAHNGTYTGVYHDGAASNWHTYHNLIDDLVSIKGPMFFQDDVSGQYTHNILCDNNFTTVSNITTTASADRNIQLLNNVMVADRSLLSEEALAIKQTAGIESAYAQLASPMKVALQIADNTMHYVVDRSTGSAAVNVKLTNNSDSTRTYTLSLMNAVSDGLEVVYPNGLTLEAGKSGIATITLQAEDVASLASSASSAIVGIRVTDNTGRTQDYPRTFTVRTSSAGGSGTTTTQRPESEVPEFDATLGEVNIAYGTPTIDGIMDDMYKNSCKIEQGPIVYPSSGNPTSDVKSTSYLVWDQTYLYCYTIVEDSTVMSRGMDILSTKAVNQLWKNDAFEFWLKVLISGAVKETKFSVDAFGIQPYGDGKFDISYHESLPYATAFTNSGSVIENYAITEPTAGQMAFKTEQPVTGYVVEMVLPLTEAEGITNKCPWVGDKVVIKVQANDLQSITNGSPNVVAFRTGEITCTLNGKISPTPEVSPTPTPEVSPTPTPEVSPTPTPEVGPTPEPEDEDDNDSNSSNDDSSSEAKADITSTTSTPGTGDNSRYGFWLAMLACGVAISVLMIKRKNRF